jgi:hypothetical protein
MILRQITFQVRISEHAGFASNFTISRRLTHNFYKIISVLKLLRLLMMLNVLHLLYTTYITVFAYIACL